MLIIRIENLDVLYFLITLCMPYIDWRPPSLSELIPMIFDMGLTH